MPLIFIESNIVTILLSSPSINQSKQIYVAIMSQANQRRMMTSWRKLYRLQC